MKNIAKNPIKYDKVDEARDTTTVSTINTVIPVNSSSVVTVSEVE